MPRSSLPPLLLVAALGLGPLLPAIAWADGATTISPFVSDSSGFSRTIHGTERTLDLSVIGRDAGSAAAFFGVDDLSTSKKQYLTSGLQWHSGDSGAPLLRMSVLRTQSRDAGLGTNQTLARAANELQLGDRWYMPSLSTEVAHVTNTNDDAGLLAGSAARVGLTENVGDGSYRIGYFSADPQFDALGSAVEAGDRGMEFTSQYLFGDTWQLSHEVRLHERTEARDDAELVQQFTIARASKLTDIGNPWRLSATLGNPDVDSENGSEPLSVRLAAQTVQWRSWRLDTSLAWYDAGMPTPLDLPIDGTYWQFSASRRLSVAGLQTQVTPSFALGESSYRSGLLGSRTGLSVGLSQLSDNIDFSIDYLSDGWSTTTGTDNDVQMMLNYRQDTGTVVPSLRSIARSLRLPWANRY